MSSDEVLIIFVKNPEKGEVKTRLAQSVGPEKALEIYKTLLVYTRDIVRPIKADLQVWYSSYLPLNDLWDQADVQKRTQQGAELGERMKNAFEAVFAEGYRRAVIIGSDCAQLETSIIREAFRTLQQHNTVIGPSKDGGYYLLGMDRLYEDLFENKAWSTPQVFEQTMSNIKRLNLSCRQLKQLNDVDTLEDWRAVKPQFPNISG